MRLLYFSPVPWDSYEQRPHYVARYFLAMGGDAVTWINPYIARLPEWNDLARLATRTRLTLDRPRGLGVIDLSAWPIDPLPGGAWLNQRLFWREAIDALVRQSPAADTVIGVGRPTALALAALAEIRRSWSFYDAMDEFPEFHRGRSRRHTRDVEAKIAAAVDRVFASSTALAGKFAAMTARVTLMRNAYDMGLLPPVATTDRAGLPLGFLGCLGRWVDWPLVSRIAEVVRPRRVTLIGPRPAPAPRRLPANVEWRPECHQVEAAAYLGTFAAGLIPFTRDPLTSGIDPIKYYQYRGAGLPVLSTAFGEMLMRSNDDGTFFLDAESGPEEAIEAALTFRPSAAGVTAFREANTWSRRFETAGLFAAV